LPILCAICYALSIIIIKKTSERDNVYSQSLQFNAAAVIISLTFYFFIGDGQYDNINHPASQYILREWFGNLEFTMPFMIIMGFSAALAFLSLFTAYRISSPAVISPFEYSILVWTSLSGWFFFDEIPSIRVFIGMFLIVSGGIYIFIREKAQDQSIVTEKPLR